MHTAMLELVIFVGGFLTFSALVHDWSKRTHFPYSVAMLCFGFIVQLISKITHYHLPVTLSSDIIYYLLLPILLFEAAMHLQLHQFRLQFKTVTFLATFGVAVSAGVIALGLPLITDLPLSAALLFGILISATDPISVLALFKELGAPKRLSLLADGESMFNDATVVIAFRMAAAIIVGGSVFSNSTLIDGGMHFLYVLGGSIAAGAMVGYLISRVIASIDNNALVETTLTVGAALLSFGAIEHFLDLSGVISAVSAGMVVGNLGQSRFSAQVVEFVEKFWEYLAFIAISLVFFFAAYTMNVSPFFGQPFMWLGMIVIVLIARAVSVYASFAISNSSRWFQDEPNVPLSWQHVLNWAGLRGVIPLVLVYSLPDTYQYKELLMAYTLASFLFTLFVNGLTIEALMRRLGLHLPRKEEQIIDEEMRLLAITLGKQKIAKLRRGEFSKVQKEAMIEALNKAEVLHKKRLLRLITREEFERSLHLQLVHYQREVCKRLFREGYIAESVLFELSAQFDMQEDALEYPEVSKGRAYREGGIIDSYGQYKKRVMGIRQMMEKLPFMGRWLKQSEEEAVIDRYSLIRARLVSTLEALEYLVKVKEMVESDKAKARVESLIHMYEAYCKGDLIEIKEKARKYTQWVEQYQDALLHKLVWPKQLALSGH